MYCRYMSPQCHICSPECDKFPQRNDNEKPFLFTFFAQVMKLKLRSPCASCALVITLRITWCVCWKGCKRGWEWREAKVGHVNPHFTQLSQDTESAPFSCFNRTNPTHKGWTHAWSHVKKKHCFDNQTIKYHGYLACHNICFVVETRLLSENDYLNKLLKIDWG